MADMEKVEWFGPNDVNFCGGTSDDAVDLLSFPWPDDSRTVMRVWFDIEHDYRVRTVRFSMPGRMTASEIRRFPWSYWLETADAFAREALVPGRRSSARFPQAASTKAVREAEKALTRPSSANVPGRPGRPGHPDEHYQAIADRYLELRSKGVRNPTATIAVEQFVNRNTVAGWLRGARERKYLPPARPGKPG